VLTPLTYLGGVFYSIKVLPAFWRKVSEANPILYMVNGFRYGFLGVSDVSMLSSFSVILTFIIILLSINLYLFRRGYGLRN
jgi:ABC-2 type transport system permease protein